MIRVGIYGASGYMGGEALRILSEHPDVQIAWATSRSQEPLEYFHQNFYDSPLHLQPPEGLPDCDVVFFAVPTGIAAQLAPDFIKRGAKIIDLGSDFRLHNQQDWERLYGQPHEQWSLAEQAIYGIPELHRAELQKTSIVANPGCFASSAIFGLAPLIKAKLINQDHIVVDGLSGTAGAGAELDRTVHHPEIANNIVPYNVVDHRHIYEMEQELGLLNAQTTRIHFTPAYIPISRGILTITHCFPNAAMTREDVLDVYRSFYSDEYFIKIFDMPKSKSAHWQYAPYPWVSAVSGTNFCHIGVDVDPQRGSIVIFSVLDSIGKGGAQAGVQNMNILFGLNETTGLQRRGMHPY